MTDHLGQMGVSPFAVETLLFFPDAAPRHRAVEIAAGDALARHHGWSI